MKRLPCRAILLWMLSASVHADGPPTLDNLLAMELGQLMDISVSSASGVPESQRHAPASMVVITAQDIRQRGYDSLVDVLQDVPGFDISVSGGTNYATAWQRGYRSPFGQRTLLLIDGVVNNELWSQAPDLSRQYPMGMIDRIEILYGPASSVYGANAFAGVINIITRRAADTDSGEWRARYGSYNTRSLEGNGSLVRGEARLAAGVRLFRSHDPGPDDLKGMHGFVSGDWLDNRNVWGPVLQKRNDGLALGTYHDPAEDNSVLLNLDYRNWTAGAFWWRATEGFGMEYAEDHAQVNVPWTRERAHVYVEHHDDLGDNRRLSTRLTLRQSGEGGDWAEAEPDWHAGQSAYSYVSYSHWNARSRAAAVEQSLDLPKGKEWRWLAGWKIERRDLAKAYSLCGYWEPASYCPAAPDIADPGPEGFGPWVVRSTAASLPEAPGVPANMTSGNRVRVYSRNVHLQASWSREAWQATAGVLLDRHSVYGAHTVPRLSLAYDLSPATTLKALYGQAWQEPPTIQVYGGWNGRNANPDLQPERAANRELVLMHAEAGWQHELSLYDAVYRHAIREDAINAAGRRIRGAEYRGRYEHDLMGHLWSGYLYYTLTRTRDDQHYDVLLGRWADGAGDIGDIARHKIQTGVQTALSPCWDLELRGRYIGTRDLYSRNPLRAMGETLPAYITADMNLRYHRQAWSTALTVNNLFDTGYENPGIASANAGIDTSQRALGYYNSVLPQAGRSAYLTVEYRR